MKAQKTSRLIRPEIQQRKHCFSTWLHWQFQTTLLISCAGADSDIMLGDRDFRSVIDYWCPRSMKGSESIKRFCTVVGIDLAIPFFDCEPFCIYYGHNGTDTAVRVEKWLFPVSISYSIGAKYFFLCHQRKYSQNA